ncbi:Mitochondrial beta-keto-acyl synthase [Nowakowskiella sp. JEL0407]|nr:Mitochondrial beta-keto-acyl synthase [Nowakowskiella sp. JEL0407]
MRTAALSPYRSLPTATSLRKSLPWSPEDRTAQTSFFHPDTLPAVYSLFTLSARCSNVSLLQEEKQLSPFMHYALAAATDALNDAGWSPDSQDQKDRTGVCVGSGIGCIDEVARVAINHAESGMKKISPYFVPKILANMAAGHISIKFGFRGPNHAVSTACTTGAHAIGDAYRFIQFGDADIMVAGGSESSISPLAMAGFAKARALSTNFNDSPHLSSRPFDKHRDGFVIGEGAGILILEELTHALRRNAKIYAEIVGYGLSGDAYHITAPREDGSGAVLSMSRALERAGVGIGDVDYVNAHATSTEVGDLVETRAIKVLVGGGKGPVVGSTKGATGHLLGAAGAVEAIFTVLAVYHNQVPPTLNLETKTEEFTLDYVEKEARDMVVNYAMTNSFGFGGTNATLVFSKI